MNSRFTLDGNDALELELGRTCARLAGRVQAIIPETKLEGIVLGGGYGRGQGGVLRTPDGDRPYNDLEFYVFLRGPRLLNQRRFRLLLDALAEQSSQPGFHTEFKIDSLESLRRSPVSMYTYDLISGHKVLVGAKNLFHGCDHHLDPAAIPLGEATRLLFNRCGGLLIAKGLLHKDKLNEMERDFVGRNLAKAQLALGDAVLTAFGQYHWDCRERHVRLQRLSFLEGEWLDEVRYHHRLGLQFKLHPRRISKPVREFERDHRELERLARELWLWIESRRLSRPFSSSREYALSRIAKCPETAPWRNYLLNLRTFGVKAGFDRLSCRYPRERLFNALALLLWEQERTLEPAWRKHVQRQLNSNAPDWLGLVAAFNQVWPGYG